MTARFFRSQTMFLLLLRKPHRPLMSKNEITQTKATEAPRADNTKSSFALSEKMFKYRKKNVFAPSKHMTN